MSASVTLWRIAAETREYKANDLSGGGSAKDPGRWNEKGQFVVYSAPWISLAVLETTAHVDSAGFPLNRFVIKLTVPIRVWKRRMSATPTDLDPAWCAIPGGAASAEFGSAWYLRGETALLEVPSVIVPEESPIMINAKHPDASLIKAETIRPFEFDKILRIKR